MKILHTYINSYVKFKKLHKVTKHYEKLQNDTDGYKK
jgi:hypothetical protein